MFFELQQELPDIMIHFLKASKKLDRIEIRTPPQTPSSSRSTVVKTIILCGVQNLPLRGKTDERSNFMALLKYRSDTDEDLREHMKNSAGNASYISHRIQNELISICGNCFQSSIIEDC